MTLVEVRRLIEEAKLSSPFEEEPAAPFLVIKEFAAFFYLEQKSFGDEEAAWYHLAIRHLPNQDVDFSSVLDQFQDELGKPKWETVSSSEWGLKIVDNYFWKVKKE